MIGLNRCPVVNPCSCKPGVSENAYVARPVSVPIASCWVFTADAEPQPSATNSVRQPDHLMISPKNCRALERARVTSHHVTQDSFQTRSAAPAHRTRPSVLQLVT